ncbi:helix-turn-helix domain-containing protein [Caenibacillus caldisaponilyticus]|uniref:helix-turn-helix domain-containing protein n=1 Tax=Caenibacillus caldisaponilyticus TaxID=1674942 RepID=UPI00098860EB|nr:helix-turn-helix transcriptional regulator [Caenibacillus caldisaponilyticus]
MDNNFLKNKRKAMGLSQQDVADHVNIDRSYYTKIENGLKPSVRVAKAIGEFLGFNWIIFFEEDCAKNTRSA